MSKLFSGHRPDLTPAQIGGVLVAGVPIIANLLHVFGIFDLSKGQEQALQDSISHGVVLAGLLFGGDAAVRASRNHHDATVKAAALSSSQSLDPATIDKVVSDPGETDGPVAGADLPSDEDEFADGAGPDDEGDSAAPETATTPDEPEAP
jgi:hypothetical protein